MPSSERRYCASTSAYRPASEGGSEGERETVERALRAFEVSAERWEDVADFRVIPDALKADYRRWAVDIREHVRKARAALAGSGERRPVGRVIGVNVRDEELTVWCFGKADSSLLHELLSFASAPPRASEEPTLATAERDMKRLREVGVLPKGYSLRSSHDARPVPPVEPKGGER